VETDIGSKNATSWFRGNRPWCLLAAHLFITSLGIQVKNKNNPLSFKYAAISQKVKRKEIMGRVTVIKNQVQTDSSSANRYWFSCHNR
jgi:hypothetical protein